MSKTPSYADYATTNFDKTRVHYLEAYNDFVKRYRELQKDSDISGKGGVRTRLALAASEFLTDEYNKTYGLLTPAIHLIFSMCFPKAKCSMCGTGLVRPRRYWILTCCRECTNLLTYGTLHPHNSPTVMAKVIQTQTDRYGGVGFASPSLRNKGRKTYKQRSGYLTPSKNPAVRSATKATCLERFGVENPRQSPQIASKIAATNKRRYGGSPMHNPLVLSKMRKSHFDKYGVENPMQRPEVFRKAQESMYRIKTLRINNKKFEYQGYEGHIIRHLVFKFDSNFVITQFHKNFPVEILSTAGTMPDLFVPSENLFIEVKSSYTLLGPKGTSHVLNSNRAKATRLENHNYKVVHVVVDSRTKSFVQLPSGWQSLRTHKLKEFLNASKNKKPLLCVKA